jgi:uncharacterized repeat protein (TIGR01451 family)
VRDLAATSLDNAVATEVLPGSASGPNETLRLTVTALPGASYGEHGLIVQARSQVMESLDSAFVPVDIYELAPRASPETVTVMRGSLATTTIQLNKVGLVGKSVRLDARAVPSGVTDPLGPAVTEGQSRTLTLSTSAETPLGTHNMSVCATIILDPRERCHATSLVLVVTGPANTSPTARNDSVSTPGTTIDIDVLANDSDPDGDPLTAELVTPPTAGAVVLVNSGTRVRYVPQVGFVGTAVFSYRARDSKGAVSNAATVKVIVPPRWDLTVVTSASDDTSYTGQEVFFNVSVSSLGGAVNANVEITDLLPAGLTYLRHTASQGAYSPATGLWLIGPINAGPAATLRIYATGASPGTFANRAVLTDGIAGDINPANSASEVTITLVLPSSNLEAQALNLSVNQHQRVLDHPRERLEEFRADGPIDRAMIATHRYAEPLPNHDAAVHDDRLVLGASDRKDASFRRIDDRRELIDRPEHAEVGHRERRSGVLLRLELSLTGELGELANFLRDQPHRLPIGVEDHRHDETVVGRDSDAEVHAVEVANLVAQPVCVDLGMLGERGGDRLEHDVVDRNLELLAQIRHCGAHLYDAPEIELAGEVESRNWSDRLG